MYYLCNGLSESMKHDPNMKQISYKLTESEFINIAHKFESCIGHQDLADYLSRITGEDIQYNRTSISVDYEDLILLVSLKGRLPEHPDHVEYKNKLNYSLIRFEKQSLEELSVSKQILTALVEV